MSTINSDEHDAKHGVKSGAGQQAGKEWRDADGCVLRLNNAQKKYRRVSERSGTKVSHTNRSAAETNSLERYRVG